MKAKRHATVAVLSLVLAGVVRVPSAGAQEPIVALEAGIPGCYNLLLDGPAKAVAELRDDIPVEIELLTGLLEHGIWRKLAPAMTLRGRELPGAWRIQEDGTLRIVWSDGYGGLLILAQPNPGGFSGSVHRTTDVVEPRDQRNVAVAPSVQLKRRACTRNRRGPSSVVVQDDPSYGVSRYLTT